MIDTRLGPYGALILRINIGAVLLAHGLFKVVFLGGSGTMRLMEKAGYMDWMAFPVIFGEVVGGIALIVGVLPRIAAIAALPIIVGATLVHVGNGWFFGAAGGGGWEYPVFLAFAMLTQGLIGDGAYALYPTEKLRRRLARQQALAPA